MASGTWDPLSLPVRPGLYINFVNAAAAQIKGGPRGVVAIPLLTYTGGTAEEKKFYTVEDEATAIELFGSVANAESVILALRGGAKEVLVYTMPAAPVTEDYVTMRNEFETRPFNVFVFDGESVDTEHTATAAWVASNREEGKHFFFVAGGDATDDLDPAVGNARTTGFSDDYVINLINGVVIDGEEYSSAEFAPYIAGLIASTPINKSITYTQVKVDDVTKRLRNSEIKTALQAGSLVLVHDGEKVKIEQGLTTNKTKIRTISARQAVSTDIPKTAADSYIGKLDNNAAGQTALILAIKAYLERLERNNVLTDMTVELDPNEASVGDTVYLLISYREIDSMERIFLKIAV